ncbi:hypothetical protein H6H03_36090 [Nostoc paludosum FACHB-159]|uniref:Uncharacterized protein n=1 Tax=Nostoc paludosum FACHB-159 TaxID=2692908 RepID=A0ABR8KMQ7_9NOSO|nr:hypothetical protein [Nostoc paludosum]MBD2682885.1 hypothetical protein [Nostoc sp. FACHB-857]MBD2739222.1 hypothetical protein [Nostoc paludosum FACHB-159]
MHTTHSHIEQVNEEAERSPTRLKFLQERCTLYISPTSLERKLKVRNAIIVKIV